MDRPVQSLRGLACVLLVVYHVIGSTGEYGLRIADGPLRELSDALAVVRMPLFALLAGAMVGWSPRTGIGPWVARSRRLLLPVLTVGTLFALVRAATGDANAGPIDWSLLHVIPVGHFWFLQSMFLLQTVVMLVEPTGLLRTFAGWSVAFGAAVVGYLALPVPIWFGASGALYLAPYFLAGMGLARYRTNVDSTRDIRFSIPLLALAAVVGALWLHPEPHQDRFTLAMLVTGMLASAGMWLARVHVPLLAKLGDHAFPIFLFHVFFTAATRTLLHRAGIDSIAVGLLLGTALGLTGPILLDALMTPGGWARRLLLGEGKSDRRTASARDAIVPRAPSHRGSSA